MARATTDITAPIDLKHHLMCPPPAGLPANNLTALSAEEMPEAIARLRREARDQIELLIMFLDATDDYVARGLEQDNDTGIGDLDGLQEQVGRMI